MTMRQDTKMFLLVEMASQISKYECLDLSRHKIIKGAKANAHTNKILAYTFSHVTLDSVVS